MAGLLFNNGIEVFNNGIEVTAIILFIVGIALLIVEMMIPGFGVAGILGIISLIACVIIQAKTVVEALIMIVVIIVILGIALWIVFRSALKGRLSRSSLVLNDSLDKESGFSSAKDQERFIGMEGVAISDLRPAGTADFDGERLNVVSESSFIDKGDCLKVIYVEGARVVVRKVTEQ